MTNRQAVLILQNILRVISFSHPHIPIPPANGIFDERTLEAVMVFQRDFGLPVTGVVDQATWKKLSIQYRTPSHPAAFLHFTSENGQNAIRPGERSDSLYLIQEMLDALSTKLEGLRPTARDGVLQGATLEDIRMLQTGCGLPATGILDYQTLFCIIRLYRIFFSPSISVQSPS